MGGCRERLEVANHSGRHRKDRIRAARNSIAMELRDFDPPMPGGDLTIVGDELAGRHRRLVGGEEPDEVLVSI